jgi:hypothetical protein
MQDARTTTRNDGSFTIAELVPGDYEVTAWSGNRTCIGAGCPCNAQAAKVTVANRQTSMVRLTACRF